MRYLVAPCAAVLLTTLVFTGCKSSPTPGYTPGWSFSKLNPFKSSSEAPPYPPTPSSLASPTSPSSAGDPAAGYAATTGNVDAPGFKSSTPAGAGSYTSPLGPEVSYGQPATNITAAAPQSGYYNSTPPYGADTPAASRPVSRDPYAPLANERYADRSFSPSSSGGPYGSPAAGSPYEAASDLYGNTPRSASTSYGSPGSSSNPYASPEPYSASPSPYRTANPYATENPYASPNSYSSPSPYDSGAVDSPGSASSPYGVNGATSAASPYEAVASRYATPSGGSADGVAGSPVGDRYASAAGAAGAVSPYPPGSSSYTPGQTGYTPGDTGYSPPGVAGYQSPASPYSTPASYGAPASPNVTPAGSEIPASTPMNVDPHFRPGSTTDYVSPASTPGSVAPANGTNGTPIPSIAYPGSAGGTTWQ